MKLLDLAIETAALLLAVAGPFWVWRYVRVLPARVPIHFNFRGVADSWGKREWIWLMPLVGIGHYLLLTWLTTLPEIQPTRLMLGLLKVEVLALYLYLEIAQIDVALGRKARLGNGIWLLTAIVLVTVFAFSVPR